jgi:hypothetical protein
MLSRVLAVFFLTVVPICSWTQETLPSGPKLISPLGPLLEVLDRANVSGSLELAGHCDVGLPPHYFPRLRVPVTTRGPLVQVVREMFADDPAIQVTQDADGMIRLIEDGAHTDLLNVKISRIWFESKGVPLQYAAFSPNTALLQILQSPEVVAFMKAHEIALAIPPQGFARQPAQSARLTAHRGIYGRPIPFRGVGSRP